MTTAFGAELNREGTSSTFGGATVGFGLSVGVKLLIGVLGSAFGPSFGSGVTSFWGTGVTLTTAFGAELNREGTSSTFGGATVGFRLFVGVPNREGSASSDTGGATVGFGLFAGVKLLMGILSSAFGSSFGSGVTSFFSTGVTLTTAFGAELNREGAASTLGAGTKACSSVFFFAAGGAFSMA